MFARACAYKLYTNICKNTRTHTQALTVDMHIFFTYTHTPAHTRARALSVPQTFCVFVFLTRGGGKQKHVRVGASNKKVRFRLHGYCSTGLGIIWSIIIMKHYLNSADREYKHFICSCWEQFSLASVTESVVTVVSDFRNSRWPKPEHSRPVRQRWSRVTLSCLSWTTNWLSLVLSVTSVWDSVSICFTVLFESAFSLHFLLRE